MSGPAHSSAPWIIGKDGDVWGAAETDCVSITPDTIHGSENASLIAAAPDLLEALEWLLFFAEAAETKALVGDLGCLWPVEIARAAIAKARGQ